MQEDIHNHIRGWLDASIRGRLSVAQKQALHDHLASCHECLRVASDPEFLEEALDIVSRRHPPKPGLENRIRRGLREDAFQGDAPSPLYRRSGVRVAVRCVLVGVILSLLGLRSLNMRYVREDTWGGRTLSALTLVFFREPRYDTMASLPPSVGPDERTFAVAHQLTKACVGMVLWTCVLLLCSFMLLDLWRRRHHLTTDS